MSITRIDIDPDGDTLIVLPEEEPIYGMANIAGARLPQTEIQFLCSKRHLTLASRRAAKIFASDFKEAMVDGDGLHHWKFEAVFDHTALEIILWIIHGRTRNIPRVIEAGLLAQIASIVDDLECHDAVWFMAKEWILRYKRTVPTGLDQGLAQLILISFVFEDNALFEISTKAALKYIAGVMPTFNLPIRPSILDQIESKREAIYGQLMAGLYSIERRLLGQTLGCSQGCRSILLGALIQGMNECRLYYRQPTRSSDSLGLDSILQSLKKLKSPTYFGLMHEASSDKYLGTWTVIPGFLVRHRCFLKDHLDPLLRAAEADMQGLRLDQFLTNSSES